MSPVIAIVSHYATTLVVWGFWTSVWNLVKMKHNTAWWSICQYKFCWSSEGAHDDVIIAQSSRVNDRVIKWKHAPCYWPFVRGIHWSPVYSPHKGQWRGALIFFICAWINGWISNREADDLRRHRTHYDVTAMCYSLNVLPIFCAISDVDEFIIIRFKSYPTIRFPQ